MMQMAANWCEEKRLFRLQSEIDGVKKLLRREKIIIVVRIALGEL